MVTNQSRRTLILLRRRIFYTFLMTTGSDDPLFRFHPVISHWFTEKVGTPTATQREAWRAIQKGDHVLITAPTGTGKTFAAFLNAIDGLIRGTTGRILYISPLKALNNDIERNLYGPLAALRERFSAEGIAFPDIRVGVRSGDTDQSERRRMITNPPEILITTPESLNLMLSSKNGVRGLTGFSVVILDEIHAVLPAKRGTFLMSAVERLVELNGEFQRIALSATVRPLDLVARIVGAYRVPAGAGADFRRGASRITTGERTAAGAVDPAIPSSVPRPVQVVNVESEKRYDLSVAWPRSRSSEPASPAPPAPGTCSTAEHPQEQWWHDLVTAIRARIAGNRSTLIFANSRRMVEKLTRLINETPGDPVYAHHGSLSREIRRVVEERLKSGELRAIIATSSLELGIDIGDIDEVILVQPPYSVASAIQRIGRAGHGVGLSSRGTFLPVHPRELIDALTLAGAIAEGAVEEINPPEKPLDVAAQIILSMALTSPVHIDHVAALLRATWAYRNLTDEELMLVIHMMAGKYADTRIKELHPRITWDEATRTITPRKGAAMHLYLSGGVIPDRGYYALRTADTNTKIGDLDEEFVWERSVGDTFPFGSTAWRIAAITHNDVLVVPMENREGIIPFWKAEEQNRPFPISQAIGEVLEAAERELAAGRPLTSGHFIATDRPLRSAVVTDTLDTTATTAATTAATGQTPLTPDALQALEEYLQSQRRHTGTPLPHRHHIVAERCFDPRNTTDAMQVILHTLWGGAVNKTFAMALQGAWQQEYGYSLEVYANNDAVLLNLPHDHEARELFTLLSGRDLPALLRDSIEASALFGARFRECAQRALLLPRKNFRDRMPLWLNRLRARKLLLATADRDDFPITLEAWRECMDGEFDIPSFSLILNEIVTGEIVLSTAETTSPSPFADAIVWRQTNQKMYEDDSAPGGLRTSLSDRLLEEILRSPHLRPEIPVALAAELQRKLHRTAEGYAPDSPEDLLDLVDQRIFIPQGEWEELQSAIRRDAGEGADEVIASVAARTATVERAGGAAGLAIRERLVFFAGDNVAQKPAPEDPHDHLAHLFLQWLDSYGPIPHADLHRRFPAPAAVIDRAVEEAAAEGRLIVDRLTAGAAEVEVCTRDNLERLLRMRRAASRAEVKPLSAGALQHFLAAHQGVTPPGSSMEELETRLERLFGYPARAGLWESDILPARLSPYYASWLDRAMAESDLLWYGCGTGRIAFAFDTELDLVPPDRSDGNDKTDDDDESARAVREALGSGGRQTFFDLSAATGLRSDEATRALWSLVWSGDATNDGLPALRRGIMANFTAERSDSAGGPAARRPAAGGGGRTGFSRWKSRRPLSGNWYALPRRQEPEDALEEMELNRERARLLLSRYGIVFREVLKNELTALQWRNVFRTLRLMELSGEVVTGRFVSGITGLQFADHGTVRELAAGRDEDAVYWINAADPASLCGMDIPSPDVEFPRRVPTTHMVFHGSRLVLTSRRNGRVVSIGREPAHPAMRRYLSLFSALLSRQERPFRRIRTEEINGEPVRESPYTAAFLEAGFVHDGPFLTLYRRY